MASAGRRRLGRRGAPEAEEDQKIRIVSSEDTHSVEKSCQNIHTVSGQKLPEAQDEKIGDQGLIRSFEYAIH